jgi:K+-sensing histidine kinase KdpD
MSDVTKVQNFEKERVAGEFKNMYLQSLAHDIRTPLNTIVNMCEHV